MKKTTILFSLFVLFFVSCGAGEAPFEHRYVVDILLKPDIRFQRAFIDSTYRLDSYLSPELTGISGAEIFIVDENSDTFKYSESDTMMGLYYSNDSFCVEYGMKYSVNVYVEGESISKEVQVPGSLDIFSPDDPDTVSLNNPPMLIWNTCEYCFENTYMITSYLTGESDSADEYEYLPMLTTDTTMGIFFSSFLFKEKDTMYTILVEAMDSNAYKFAQMWVEYDEIKEGVIGLIGAVSFDTVVVWVTE
jgi:hypothetical protein